MAQPEFLSRLRRQQETEPVEYRDDIEKPLAPAANRFTRAADELGETYADMEAQLESWKASADEYKNANVWLNSEVARLKKELETRTQFFDLEVERLTLRADRAVDQNVDRRAKIQILSKALMLVLQESAADEPVKREEPAPPNPYARQEPMVRTSPPRVDGVARLADKHIERRPTFNDTPREGHPPTDEDGETARDLINRMAPIKFATRGD